MQRGRRETGGLFAFSVRLMSPSDINRTQSSGRKLRTRGVGVVGAPQGHQPRPHQRDQLKATAEYSLSLVRRCWAVTRRTVPDLERMTRLWVDAPLML